MKKFCLAVLIVFLCAFAYSQNPASTQPAASPATGAVTVTKKSGGSMRIESGLGAELDPNKDISLERQWVTIHDSRMPIDLKGTPGTKVNLKATSYAVTFSYHSDATLVVRRPVVAVEIKYLTFDVWGGHQHTLVDTELKDMEPGEEESKADYSLYDDSEAMTHFASIAYISKVRAKDGQIFEADEKAVIEQARLFEKDFAPAELEPEKKSPATSK